MLLTLPSGKTQFAPISAPTTWVDQAAAVAGSPVTAAELERNAGSAVAYHRRPALFQGVATGSQNIASSTWTACPLGEIIDVHGGHSDDTDPARVKDDLTEAIENWYLCTGYTSIAGAASGVLIAGIRLDGSTIYEGGKIPLGAGHAATAMVCDLLKMGQYIELMTYQNSGGALATQVGTTKAPTLTMRWACSATGTTVALPSTPRTWTGADMLTADLAGAGQVPLNVHVRDVVHWLRYPPACRIDSTGTSQTIPSGAWTSINMVAEQLDNYGGHSTSSNTSRYTCQRAGLYFVHGLASIADAGTTGYRASRLLVNGTTIYAGTSTKPATTTTIGTALPACAHIRLAAGDYVELQSFQSQGSALAVKTGAGDSSRLIALWRGL